MELTVELLTSFAVACATWIRASNRTSLLPSCASLVRVSLEISACVKQRGGIQSTKYYVDCLSRNPVYVMTRCVYLHLRGVGPYGPKPLVIRLDLATRRLAALRCVYKLLCFLLSLLPIVTSVIVYFILLRCFFCQLHTRALVYGDYWSQ